ncbi:MAG: beta-ketoacyl-ACP synthase II [Candidatus Tectomicrobia bacterium]|nr:beta-ketoacyl-ACP synthase II [Candidatus Tectomicrobia bacterium]
MSGGKQRRVVITGIGAVTPIGHTREGLWQGVLRGKSGVRRVRAFDISGYRSQVAAEVLDFDAAPYLDRKQLKRLDRYSQFALCAAKMAVADAELDLEAEAHERVGVCIGSALGGMLTAEEQHGAFAARGLGAVSPMLAVTVFGAAASCNIAIEFGVTGPNTANCNSCAAGTMAIGDALRFIQRGESEVMLAGGAEAPIAPLCFGSFSIIRAMSKRNHDPERACRPFDKGRDGFVMGEGAAILVLEDAGHAERRGAHIYAEILGYSLTNDAYHMSAPHPGGVEAARAMAMVLKDAGLGPEDIEYINAHGSSTPMNDKIETMAIKQVFGGVAGRIPVSGTKGLYGHALGASGAIEAAIGALALTYKYVPPTVNYETPDPECDLDYVPNIGRSAQVRYLMSNSFGFGGINACLVLGRYGQ